MAKYQKIIDWITECIDEGTLKPGEKLPSENELCDRFGLSRQTVRHAIAKLAEDGLLESRRGSGTYLVDQRAEEGERNVIAVVTTYVDDYIFPSTIRGIESTLSDKGYSMQLSFSDNTVGKERQILTDLLSRSDIAGIIMEPVKSALPNPNMELYRKLRDRNVKILFINSFYPELDMPHVSLNDAECAYRAVKALINLGHRDIGCVLKLDDGQGRERYRGYLKAITEAGVPFSYDHVNWIDTIDIRNGKEALIKARERLKGCSAVFCYNDQVAGMLMEVLIDGGLKIPQQMSIVAMDDSDIARMGVRGTTISSIPHPKAELGKRAAQNMIRMIHSGQISFSATYEFKEDVILRDSVRQYE
ncbi:GntR family transcriptional regulator [Butyrivibrio sp. FCS014]|uniref:GntR family transcriptional regulator n=1 Tax=Butyrivibrio sp. FCS014 TaxID=1408304 RepID=UPI000466D285|nr:GntR family transcriptional regulator [Butyrivibrio sp. FCS014]